MIEESTPIWIPLYELLKTLRELDMWTMDTKYLHLYLDTRFINGDFHCTVKDREGNKYLSLEELRAIRKPINDVCNS